MSSKHVLCEAHFSDPCCVCGGPMYSDVATLFGGATAMESGKVAGKGLMNIGQSVFAAFGGSASTSPRTAGCTGLLLAGAVVWAISYYVTNFTGDFEATGDLQGRAGPTWNSNGCGESHSEGDNLDCHAGACDTMDTANGRWVHLEGDETGCWMPYSSLRYQHGAMMSLVGLAMHLETTSEAEQEARAGYRTVAEAALHAAATAPNWERVAQIDANLTAASVTLDAASEGTRKEGRDRYAFGKLLAAAGNTGLDLGTRLAAIDQAAALEYPPAKPELAALSGGIESAAFDPVLARATARPDDLADALADAHDLLSLADLPSAAQYASLSELTVRTATRLRSHAAEAPEVVAAAAHAIGSNRRLVAALGDAKLGETFADLSGALAPLQAQRLATAQAALANRRATPAAKVAAICALPGLGVAVPDSDALRAPLDDTLRRSAGEMARAYANDVFGRAFARWQRDESAWLTVVGVPAREFQRDATGWLANEGSSLPRSSGLQVAEVTLSACDHLASVRLTFPRRADVTVLVGVEANAQGQWRPTARPQIQVTATTESAGGQP